VIYLYIIWLYFFVQARLTFPCDMSVFDVEKTLEWDANVTTINQWPLSILDDGDVIYYKYI